ncbi:hypothetical protein B0I35DRAFT_420659 [Stachybotrys elegans]|uniref:Uncharacterized protein n=1 Tax=Stachybotrys elegans TaxID=80388 RepID=A0A8K0WZ91_9HYPO|nr:hypothetical protein B0I35DRAFT_420659 [Stachybotrys elegans]
MRFHRRGRVNLAKVTKISSICLITSCGVLLKAELFPHQVLKAIVSYQQILLKGPQRLVPTKRRQVQ